MEWLVLVVRPISVETTYAIAGGLDGDWQRLLLPRAGELRTSSNLPGWDAII
jgi:hypothetical protein